MKIKKPMVWVSKIMAVALIPVLLFSFNALLFLNPSYLEWEYSKPDFPKSEEFTDRERRILSRNVLAYVKDITDISTLEDTELFNEREKSLRLFY